MFFLLAYFVLINWLNFPLRPQQLNVSEEELRCRPVQMLSR